MKVDKSKWAETAFAEIATSQLGKTLDANKNKGLPYPYLCAANIGMGYFNLSNVKEILLDDSELEKYLVRKGDLLICEGGDTGRCAIWESEDPIYYQNALHRVRFNDGIHNKFIMYYLHYYKKVGIIDKLSHGQTIKHFTQKGLSKLSFRMPTISEQKGIASELDAIQAMIDGYNAQLHDLDELIKSIFNDTFGEPISNPKGWDVDILENIVSDDCPITYGIVQPGDDVNEGIPVVRPVDLIGTYVNKTFLKKVSPEISDSYKRTILKGNEILICVRGTTGVVSFATEDMKGCNVTRGIVPLSFIRHNKWFMYWCIKSYEMNNLIQKYTKGATLKQINIKDLRQLPFPTPPLELQEKFGKQAELIETQRALLNQQIYDARNLMAERMQYYFS